MEIVLLAVILILIISNNSNQSKKIERTNSLLNEVLRQIHGLNTTRAEKSEFNSNEEVVSEEQENESTNLEIDEIDEIEESEIEIENIPSAASSINEFSKFSDKKENQENDKEPEPEIDTEPIESTNTEGFKSKESKTFLQKHPDIERFIGENLINKIGIAILVLGIGFFVKYAIDQNWINEIARVGIGLLSGAILIGIAHRIRITYKSFSSVLIGGGIAVFYFTIAIAFHQYHIINNLTAFIAMVLITSFSILISIYYDRIELAVISLIGGFATPFMLSTGEGNHVVLFTYLLILNTGMLVMAFFKKWNLINILSYLLTVLIFGGWMMREITNTDNPPYADMLLFSSLFYILFFLMNIANNILSGRNFKSLEIAILLSNTFLYYSVGMTSLEHLGNGNFQGLYTGILAVVNFVFAFVLYKYKKADENLIYLLVGLVLTFVSLAGPVQLEGNYITLFWSAEAALLLWLAYKAKNKLMALTSIAINVLMIVNLLMDWVQIYFLSNNGLDIILNKGFVTGMVVVISLSISFYIQRINRYFDLFNSETDDKGVLSVLLNGIKLDLSIYQNFLTGLMIVVLYFSGLLEFNFQLDQHFDFYPMRSVILASYHFTFFLSLGLTSVRLKQNALLDFTILLLIITLLAQISFYNQQVIQVRDEFLMNAYHLIGFLYHFVDLILVLSILSFFIWLIKNKKSFLHSIMNASVAVMSVYLLILLSMELDHIFLWAKFKEGSNFEDLLSESHKIAFPIFWGIFAFSTMWIGMKYKLRYMRITSLLILLVTLIKLFVFDIRNVSEGGKILAFICLGVLLLFISFMYQKLKKLIVEDESNSNE